MVREEFKTRNEFIKNLITTKQEKYLLRYIIFLVLNIIFVSLSFYYTFIFLHLLLPIHENNEIENNLIYLKSHLTNVIIFSLITFIVLFSHILYVKINYKSSTHTTTIFYKISMILLFSTFFCICAIIGLNQLNNNKIEAFNKDFIITQVNGGCSVCLYLYLCCSGITLIILFIVGVNVLYSLFSYFISLKNVKQKIKKIKVIKINNK